MFLFLFLIRRMNPRVRALAGGTLTLAGLIMFGLAGLGVGSLGGLGVITVVVGLVFFIAAYMGYRKAQEASLAK